jgi:SGNH domain (fused to AT3 domains)
MVSDHAGSFSPAPPRALVLAGYGGTTIATDGLPSRFGDAPLRLLADQNDVWARRAVCMGQFCQLGRATPNETSFLLWGDSHASSLAPAVDRSAVRLGRHGLLAAKNGCAPFIRRPPYRADHQECAAFADSVMALIDAKQVGLVLLHARWSFYADGERYRDLGGFRAHVRTSSVIARNAETFDPLFAATVAELLARNIRVAIIADVPEVSFRVPTALAQRAITGFPAELAPRYEDVVAQQAQATSVLRRIAQNYRLPVAFPNDVLCDRLVCKLEDEDHALYVDEDHLSVRGAQKLEALIDPLFRHYQ